MIIGITGTDGAGKGTVVEYFVEHKGFMNCSARAIWIEEIERRGIENSRASMRIVANELRSKHGNDFLVTHYFKKIEEAGEPDAIIDSIRALAEAETLKQEGGVLLAVDADQKLRYERIQERASTSDQVSFDEFVAQEKLEMNDPDPNGMQKKEVIESADFTIQNNGTLEELHTEIEKVLRALEV